MLTVIKDIEQISELQKRFKFLLKKYADEEVKDVILVANREYRMTVYWNKDKKIIYPIGEHSSTGKDRFWNAFGSSPVAPKSNKKYNIMVEINFPCDIKSKPHGAFAVDSNDNDKVFILHNGLIRVGKQSCNIFHHGFKGEVIEPEEIDVNKKFALVCQLTEANQKFVNRLAVFIDEIKYIRLNQKCKSV